FPHILLSSTFGPRSDAATEVQAWIGSRWTGVRSPTGWARWPGACGASFALTDRSAEGHRARDRSQRDGGPAGDRVARARGQDAARSREQDRARRARD